MREIKFRAWDKQFGRMWHWGNHGNFRMEAWGRDFKTIYLDLDFELMQYTGLKDRTGKEIYESDVVKDSNYADKIGFIVFKEGGFLVDYGDKGKYYLGDRLYYEPIVIGNIYENPELLKEV